MKKIILVLVGIFTIFSFSQSDKKKLQDAIEEEFLTNCAAKYPYTTRMTEWQNCLDQGLKKDSTIAHLWQQKAMPYYKARKYEVGLPFLDKAVKFDAPRWQSYRAFMKCIFAKNYKDAIADFEDCKKKFGNGYVMDHSYDFYIAISYLQLNEYEKAQKLLKNYVDEMYEKRDKLEHPTALFYLGIAEYELRNHEAAIVQFDKALKIYPQFSEVKYYKGVCESRLGRTEIREKLWKESSEDDKNGFRLNEDNTIYETYPYQLRWRK
jgi:tetratricopeptide (TPR) repeat protein